MVCQAHSYDKIAGHAPVFRLLICAVAVIAVLGPALALEDGRIGVLHISDPVRSAGFDFLRTEPIFSLTFVAASLRGFGGWTIYDVQRAIWLYLPRSYQDLVGRSDVIVLGDANRDAFTPRQIELFATAVKEAGLGLFMHGGWESFGGTGSHGPPWGQTAVGRLLPTEDIENARVESGRVVIIEKNHEFISSLPWHRKSPFMTSFHHNVVTVKAGGRLLAITDRNTFQYGASDHPLLVTWEIPEGARVFACTGEIELMAISYPWQGTPYLAWEYYGDFSSNLMIYLAKRPVPQDIDLVHAVRSKGFETRTRSSLLLNLLEFIESFGANTQGVMKNLDAINEMIAESRQDYIELRFDEVFEAYVGILNLLEGLEEESMVLKDRALLWVYLIEWLAVTGTLLLSGFILWTLMFRRRLYREIEVTKLVEA